MTTSSTAAAPGTERRYCLFTDAPPLRTGGHGAHVLASNWIQALRGKVALVATRRQEESASREAVRSGAGVDCAFFADIPSLARRGRWAGAVRVALEFVLFLACVPRLRRAIRTRRCDRIFGLMGGEGWFLLKIWILSSFCRLPFDVYLVEDLEQWARLTRRFVLPQAVRWIEPFVLRRAARVFVISPGYIEHLKSKYGIQAAWLPVVVPDPGVVHRPYIERTPGIRDIVFLGGLNSLNEDCLKNLMEAIRKWNDSPKRPWSIRLHLLTYSPVQPFLSALVNPGDVKVTSRASRDQIRAGVQDAWALFLPYTFDETWRDLVTTAFPTKFSECLASGRPVIAYGPPYASISRYFVEQGFPLCVTAPEGLAKALETISEADTPETVEKYERAIRRFHAPDRVAERLRS